MKKLESSIDMKSHKRNLILLAIMIRSVMVNDNAAQLAAALTSARMLSPTKAPLATPDSAH